MTDVASSAPESDPRPLGAVLAGGRGRRFGGGKPGAEVAGVPLAERAARTLDRVAEPVILFTDDAELAARLGRPRRPDRRPGAGPLAGVESALLESRTLGRRGALVLACDMPLVPPRVLEAVSEETGGWDAVLPESPGPLGVEPLCGFYATSSLEAVQRALDAGRRSAEGLLERLRVRRVPTDRLGAWEAGESLFLNVNTPEERERAEAALAEGAAGERGTPP